MPRVRGGSRKDNGVPLMHSNHSTPWISQAGGGRWRRSFPALSIVTCSRSVSAWGTPTVALAERFPGTGFLGVEIHSPGVGKVLREIHTKGLDNLRVVQADAFHLFEQLLLPDSFDGVHIFFPDPWPKRKHHKRRMIQSPFLDILHPFMKEGAYLYITTDWEEYASQILQVCSSHPAFVNEYGGFAPRQVWRPVTKYERKGAREHHPIWEVFVFKRTSSSG